MLVIVHLLFIAHVISPRLIQNKSSLTTESGHGAKFIIGGGATVCHNDNIRCPNDISRFQWCIFIIQVNSMRRSDAYMRH